MTYIDEPALLDNTCDAGADVEKEGARGLKSKLLRPNKELVHIATTFATTLGVFGIFFVQGIILARILGPIGRGEFGTAIQIPRDLLLYAGLLGGIEIANSYAAKGVKNMVSLKYSAARMGLVTGTLTAIVAGLASVIFLFAVGKQQLIPFCLLCCFFLPWEHMHLVISGVDRGTEDYGRYNFNRIVFAASFPLLVLLAFMSGFVEFLGIGQLTAVCVLFVISKVVGLLPTLRGMNVLGFIRRDPSVMELLHSSDEKTPSTKTLLKEGRPYALSVFASELFERMDVLLIVALATLEECGYYMVAVPAAALLTVAPSALGVFTFNAGADESRKVSTRQAAVVAILLVVLQVVSTIALALIVPWLIIKFYTVAFTPSIEFALWLLPAAAIKGYLQSADGYLKGAGHPIVGVWSRVISTIVMIGFVWLTFHSFENRLLSIPIAACVGQAISMVVITYFVFADIRAKSEVADA